MKNYQLFLTTLPQIKNGANSKRLAPFFILEHKEKSIFDSSEKVLKQLVYSVNWD